MLNFTEFSVYLFLYILNLVEGPPKPTSLVAQGRRKAVYILSFLDPYL